MRGIAKTNNEEAVEDCRMNSVGGECNDLKAKYDACFQIWFSQKFLKGDTSEDMCKPLFIVYQNCVRNAIREQKINMKEVDQEILGTFSEKQEPLDPDRNIGQGASKH